MEMTEQTELLEFEKGFRLGDEAGELAVGSAGFWECLTASGDCAVINKKSVCCGILRTIASRFICVLCIQYYWYSVRAAPRV